ncbi:transporter [Aestuariivivens sediminis]|uniref:transporter n=1 Tax=Aestuariivivens sediminis TaxID=2913557 RepID=UPI001F579A2B|nr:transporter [Aestuariivivens sediminis]
MYSSKLVITNNYFKFLIFILFLYVGMENLSAQGCVAIRGYSSCSMGYMDNGINLKKGEFTVGSNFRYFESFRHFRGTEEETNRIEDGTQVINDSYFSDITFNYGISERLYANLLIPFVSHVRSSMYEHGGNSLSDRHNTRSSGLSDIRLGAGYWLVKPNSKPFNLAMGVGIKLPTGDYRYTDTFYNQGDNKDLMIDTVVDQSIQPGDGGVGFNLDLQGYHTLSHHFMLTTTLYYLLNPRETNGVLTRNGSSEFSVPDQYAAQLGVFYFSNLKGLNVYLGGRLEGVPSSDIIGGSAGYRRPGYVISIDPGVNYSVNNLIMSLNVPVALERNRTRSYLDKQRTAETGVYRHGDAAFADYLVSFNLTYKFSKKQDALKHPDIPDYNIENAYSSNSL